MQLFKNIINFFIKVYLNQYKSKYFELLQQHQQYKAFKDNEIQNIKNVLSAIEKKQSAEQSAISPLNKTTNICIGIPHMGIFHWQTLSALLSLRVPPNCVIKYHMVGSSLVYEARDSIAKFAIENDCDYVLYLDSDMVPPSDMIMKMLNTFDQRPESGLVTGMAFKRIPPFQPCFYTKVTYDTKMMRPTLESPIEFPDEGLIEIQGCGMACCMIKTEVFRQVDAELIGDRKHYFFPLPNMGEDLTFCLKAKHKAIKMYVDLSIDVGHISSMPIVRDHFRACYNEYKSKNTSEPLFKEV